MCIKPALCWVLIVQESLVTISFKLLKQLHGWNKFVTLPLEFIKAVDEIKIKMKFSLLTPEIIRFNSCMVLVCNTMIDEEI